MSGEIEREKKRKKNCSFPPANVKTKKGLFPSEKSNLFFFKDEIDEIGFFETSKKNVSFLLYLTVLHVNEKTILGQ